MNAGQVPVVVLSNGIKIPFIGFGTNEGDNPSGGINCAVEKAISSGYRYIDCALLYQNEIEVGEGICTKILDGTVDRDEMIVSSKLWNTFHDPEMVKDAFEISRFNLNLDFLDLYLMHWPMAYKECAGILPKSKSGRTLFSKVPFTDTWKAMEKLEEDRLTRGLGISNFSIKQILKLMKTCRIKPVLNQIESHPYFPNKELKEYCHKLGIAVVGYCPLGCIPDEHAMKEGLRPVLAEDPVIMEIAKKYNQSPASIVLRYAYQNGTISIPGSTKDEHIDSNIQIFNFCICKEDMDELNNLNKNIRFNSFYWAKKHPDYPFSEAV